MVSVMSGMLYKVVGTTAERDSLVLCEIHLHHVTTAPSLLEGGPSLQHKLLLLLTTGENKREL